MYYNIQLIVSQWPTYMTLVDNYPPYMDERTYE